MGGCIGSSIHNLELSHQNVQYGFAEVLGNISLTLVKSWDFWECSLCLAAILVVPEAGIKNPRNSTGLLWQRGLSSHKLSELQSK